MPNLAVTLAPAATAVRADGVVRVAVSVANTGTAGSQQTRLDVALPRGLALVGSPSYEIGSGCSGAQQIDCVLDYLPNGAQTRVAFDVRAVTAGLQTITATVSGDRDSDPRDNAVSVGIDVAAAVAAPQVVPVTQVAAHTISGTSRSDRLRGSAANDVLYGLGGADILLGLKGNDVLYGGAGNDALDGGAGVDRLFGGPGNDTLRARDGRRDLVDCGPGRDTAVVDRIDRVSGCELVKRAR